MCVRSPRGDRAPCAGGGYQASVRAASRCVKIIAPTACAMKGDDERAFAAGCDGYILKPIDTRTLPAIGASYLEQP